MSISYISLLRNPPQYLQRWLLRHQEAGSSLCPNLVSTFLLLIIKVLLTSQPFTSTDFVLLRKCTPTQWGKEDRSTRCPSPPSVPCIIAILVLFCLKKINIPPRKKKKWIKPLTKEARAVSHSKSQFAQRSEDLSHVCNRAVLSIKDACLMQIAHCCSWGSPAAPWELYLAQAVGWTLCAIPRLRTSPNQEEQGYKAKMTNE